MNAADGRITAANVQTVARNLSGVAVALGLIEPGEYILTTPGTPSAGIPWSAAIVTPTSERDEYRHAYLLPRTLGNSAREAHATLTAALVALREVARAQREHAPRFAPEGTFDYYRSEWQSIEGHEDTESGGVFRLKIAGTGHHSTKSLSITPEQARTILETLSTKEQGR